MDEALAYGTLAMTVMLAVARPRLGLRGLRLSPGAAALLSVVVLLLTGLLSTGDMLASARIQWRPLLALTCVMVMTGVVQEVGAFTRLSRRIESHARATSATIAFTLVFVLSVVTPSLLNNDAAILDQSHRRLAIPDLHFQRAIHIQRVLWNRNIFQLIDRHARAFRDHAQ